MQNKKHWIIRISVVFALVLLLAIQIIFIFPFKNIAVSPYTCENFFGCTVTEFLNEETELPGELKNIRKNAFVDENGVLHFSYTYYQKYKLLNAKWLNTFPELKIWQNIVISEDYSTITLYCPPELEELTVEELQRLEDDLRSIITRIRFIDLLDSGEFRIIKYYRINRDSGEILTSRDLTASASSMDEIIFINK